MAELSAAPGSRGSKPGEGDTPPQLILVAPNVAERMGGEAIMALQIYEELVRRGIDVHQVTHGRVRDELALRLPEMQVSYVEDDRLMLFLCRFAPLRFLIEPYFMWNAA